MIFVLLFFFLNVLRTFLSYLGNEFEQAVIDEVDEQEIQHKILNDGSGKLKKQN